MVDKCFKYVLLVLLVFFLMGRVSFADTFIMGWDEGDHCNGDGNFKVWKGILFTATSSGDADYFGIYAVRYTGNRTSDDIGYAVYSDSGGSPNELMCYGYTPNYNWTTIGTGEIHKFAIQNVVTTRAISGGTDYWVFYNDSCLVDVDDSFWTGRNNTNGTPLLPKFGASSWTPISTPPPVGSINIDYGLSNYEFSIWDGEDTTSSPTTSTQVSTSISTSTSTQAPTTTTTTAAAGINIASAVGTFSHGDNVVIGGSGFGSKSPAAPLIWDDCEGRTVDNDGAVAAVWDQVNPMISMADVPAYRTRYRTVPHSSVAAPHGNSSQYLSGGHYQHPNNSPPYIGTDSTQFKNVLVTVDSGSAHSDWFATWYYRVHPQWRYPCPSNNNHKYCVSNTGGEAWIGQAYEASNTTAPCLPGDITVRSLNGGCGEIGNPTDNPRLDWVRYERRWGTRLHGGFRQVLVNNEDSNYVDSCGAWQATRSFTIGGYYRWTPDIGDSNQFYGGSGGTLANPENNAFRYFDDMYVDTTYSRVMLGNSATYSNCTILEPQIPYQWSPTSVSVTVNLGQFGGGTAYLYVFDSNDEHNSTGYAVTIDGTVTTISTSVPTTTTTSINTTISTSTTETTSLITSTSTTSSVMPGDCSACAGEFALCWTGDHAGHLDRACAMSGSTVLEGTNVGVVVSDTYGEDDNGALEDNNNDRLCWDVDISPSQATFWVSMKPVDDDRDTRGHFFEALYEGNAADHITLYLNHTDDHTITARYRAGTTGTQLINSNETLTTGGEATWVRIGYSYDSENDKHALNVEGAGWQEEEETLDTFSQTLNRICIGEYISGTGHDDTYWIDNAYFIDGTYQGLDPSAPPTTTTTSDVTTTTTTIATTSTSADPTTTTTACDGDDVTALSPDAYFHMTQASNTDATDCESGLLLSYHGTPSQVDATEILFVSDNGDYYSASDVYFPDIDCSGDALTLSIKVKLTDLLGTNGLIGKGIALDGQYSFYVSSGGGVGFCIYTGPSVGSCVWISDILSVDTYHDITGVYDGSDIKLYIHGNEVASTSKTGSINDGTSNFEIGRTDSMDAKLLDGTIDYVAVWCSALSEGEIQTFQPTTSSVVTTIITTTIPATTSVPYTSGDIWISSISGSANYTGTSATSKHDVAAFLAGTTLVSSVNSMFDEDDVGQRIHIKDRGVFDIITYIDESTVILGNAVPYSEDFVEIWVGGPKPTLADIPANTTTVTTTIDPCSAGTYLSCWNGDYTSDTDKACFDSGASAKDGTQNDGTIGTDYGETGNGFRITAEDQYLKWAVSSEDGIDDEEGTVWMSVYVTEDESRTDSTVFEAHVDVNNGIDIQVKGNNRVRGRHEGDGAPNNLDDATIMISPGEWHRIGYTWKVATDFHCVAVNESAWVCQEETLTAFDEPLDQMQIGEDNTEATQTDTIDIDNVYVTGTYQDDDPL